MTIRYSKQFLKHFRQRIQPQPALHKKFNERIKLFTQNPADPTLRDHQLVGVQRQFRSFSISGDVRVIYSQESKNEVLLIDVGTHNQVYS